MGSPALTSRGFIESDFEEVAELVHRGIQIAKTLKAQAGAYSSPCCFCWYSTAYSIHVRRSVSMFSGGRVALVNFRSLVLKGDSALH